MDQLWAPWRLNYVANPKPRTSDGDCFVCRAVAGSDDRANHVVARTDTSIVMLNRFPYTNGHLLIIPKAHKARLDELTLAESVDLQAEIVRYTQILERNISADGFNVGLNLGRAAGAGLPGHLHWHIVPRWNGDTNFMAVLNDVRVIVQSLDAVYDMLVAARSHSA